MTDAEKLAALRAEIAALHGEALDWEWPPTFATFSAWLGRVGTAAGAQS